MRRSLLLLQARFIATCGAAALSALIPACGGSGSSSPTAPAQGAAPVVVASATANYQVTFEAEWSAATHPEGIPPNPHFSPLVGATHAEATRFWEVGAIASDGIRDMAERGRTSPLDAEIDRAIAAGQADALLLGDPIPFSPGRARIRFEVRLEQPFVTLVSMIAPSPDWFVGVSALPLLEGGDWARRIDVDLFAYDAGTDGGRVYTAINRPLAAREPIRRLERAPFVVDGEARRLGTFQFRRIE